MTVWGHYYDDDREVEEATHVVPWNEKGPNGDCYFCWLERSWCGEPGLLTVAVSPLLRTRIEEPKMHPVSPADAYFFKTQRTNFALEVLFLFVVACEFLLVEGDFETASQQKE